ncbi:MAG: hypothetical protein GF383_01330 [Candidatus Lokiarchaeota archaeon]|nr:hypothetical protein [Candidatus Lokiarchaeota archaeon]MBD3337908.1 hypothetical protein [Candidatus Lokiarchaeota archaeon]
MIIVNEKKNSNQIEKEDELFIPPIPPPNKKSQIQFDETELSKEQLESVKQLDLNKYHPILVKCEQCNKNKVIPIPIKKVQNIDSREILIAYLHQNKETHEIHCIIFEIDHQFNVYFPKATDVLMNLSSLNDAEKLEKANYKIRTIFVLCDICRKTLQIQVPEKIQKRIKESHLPKIPLCYIHTDEKGNEPHCLVVFIDKNYGDRNRRLADILIFE